MIECKYKTEPTKWFFLPDPYSYQNEVNQNSFLHTFDHFLENKFIFKQYPYHNIQEHLGPFCLKGTEIFSNSFVEINILKAISQLSYAFVNQIITSIENQLNDPFFENCTFFNIPIIVTNAELHILNEKVTTKDIQKAENIDEISKKCDFLLYDNKISESLKQHNIKLLTSYFETIDIEIFNKRNKSIGEDVTSFIDLISSIFCPQSILIMHHDEGHKNYQKLFDYINFFFKDLDKLKNETKKLTEKLNKELEMLNSKK